MNENNMNLPPELDEIGSTLRQNRHEASNFELDGLKREAMSRVSRPSRARAGRGSRAVSSFLLMGVLMSGASASVIAGTSGTAAKEPSASISQYEQIVLGERIEPGSARLIGPTGCVARAFRARVAGQNVAKVVFKIDGKRVKTLTKPNLGASSFMLKVNPAKFRIGVHRLVATTTFKPATKKKPQTLRLAFQRCAKKLAAPRFTG